ncbi:MAG: TolC family protein [Xanthomonadaceae bacterium]|nr:TolC family protein [Xanthomonadaceae bacterium]
MKKISNLIIIFFIQVFNESAASTLTKLKALEQLKGRGLRWRQTEVLKLEADAKSSEAKSYKRLQLHFSAKEFLGKVNPLQYGLTIANDGNLIAVGTSGIEGGYLLFDQAISERIDAAESNQLYTHAQSESYQNDLISLMLVQYLNVQKMKLKTDMLSVSKKRANEVLKIASAKVNAGLGVKLDLMRAEALVAAEELKGIDAEMALAKAKQELATTLGQEQLNDDLENLEPILLDGDEMVRSISDPLDHRADLKALKQGVKATQLMVTAAKHDRWPKVLIYGSWGVFNAGTTPFGLAATSSNGLGGIAISMPIYTGGRLDGKEQEEAAKALKTELQESQLRLEAKSQIKLSLDQVRTTRAAVDVTNRKVKILNEELRLIQKKYQSGSGSGIEVTNTLVGVAETHDSNIDAIYGYELAKVGLFKNLGNFDEYFKRGIKLSHE